jgi:hypothetical protein
MLFVCHAVIPNQYTTKSQIESSFYTGVLQFLPNFGANFSPRLRAPHSFVRKQRELYAFAKRGFTHFTIVGCGENPRLYSQLAAKLKVIVLWHGIKAAWVRSSRLPRPTSRRNAYPIRRNLSSSEAVCGGTECVGVRGRTKREKRAAEALPQEQQTANTNTTRAAATEQKPPASQSTRQLIDSDNWTEVSVCCESAIFLLAGSKDRVRARECALLQQRLVGSTR